MQAGTLPIIQRVALQRADGKVYPDLVAFAARRSSLGSARAPSKRTLIGMSSAARKAQSRSRATAAGCSVSIRSKDTCQVATTVRG